MNLTSAVTSGYQMLDLDHEEPVRVFAGQRVKGFFILMVGWQKTFRPWDVKQAWLLPASVHDFVPPEHLAHLVREIVRDELDLAPILSVYDEERGQPPYHPAMMVALLLYTYSRGMYSSRQIARGCEERLDFQAVTALNRPDFRTISDFRQRHLEAWPDCSGRC